MKLIKAVRGTKDIFGEEAVKYNYISRVAQDTFESYSLFLTRTAQHEEGDYGKQHANPLIKVQAFAKHNHGTYKHHYGTRRINRSHDGQRQMLHPEITEYPGRKHDKRLDNNKLMHLPPHHGNIKHRTSQH